MILHVLGWLALADAVAAVALAGIIYGLGRKCAVGVSVARAIGLALLLGLPAAALYVAAWLLARLF